MPPNEKEFVVRNRISHLSTALPVRPVAASAAELTAGVRHEWSSSVQKRRWTAAQIILRRLLKAAKPATTEVQHDC